MVGFLIAVLSGVLMSVQGIFNTQVTKASSIWSANVFVQATALLSCLAVWLAADRSNLFAVFRSEPKYLLLGGVLGAGITWTVIKAMAMLGPARAVLFIAKVEAVHVDEKLLDDKGRLRLEDANLLAYSHGEYFELGEKIGKFGFSVAKKK